MSENDVIKEYNLTDREVQLIIKAMVTVLASGGKVSNDLLLQAHTVTRCHTRITKPWRRD